MITYWLRISGRGYLGFDGKPTTDINEIRDFPTLGEAQRWRHKYKGSFIFKVTFDLNPRT